jgi:phage terminase large subunit-like protein
LIIHDSPDQSVKDKADVLLNLRKRPGYVRIGDHRLTHYEHAIRELILKDPWFLIRFVLQFHHFDEILHGQKLLRHYFYPREDRDKAIAIPRDHLKTSTSMVINLQRLLRNPNIALLISSATEGLARAIGAEIADHLIRNDYIQAAFPDIAPKNPKDCSKWGLKGYQLPFRKPRRDDSIFCCSLNTTITGRHPDVIVGDDLIGKENNNEKGWKDGREFLKTCIPVLPPHGYFELQFTRWNDNDPYADCISGDLRGKQGPFDCLVMSCWEDDEAENAPIYPRQRRWNGDRDSGYSTELLLNTKASLGDLFNSQYLNDPVPERDQPINVKNVQVYEKDKSPKFGRCVKIVCEVTGGGLPIFSLIEEEALKINLPIGIEPVNNPKTIDKHDRILKNVEPIVRMGRLWVQSWMLGPSTDSFEYELKRLGAAKHDDIVDCLSNIIEFGIAGSAAKEGGDADLYIGVDPAWSDKKRSDFTVIMAVAIDDKANYYIIDYDRFKEKSPTIIANRVIEFYRRFDSVSMARNSVRVPKLASSYC